MSTDRTRTSDDHRQGYRGVVAQQGRVILDRDLNALQEIAAEESRVAARDFLGPFGSPDDGFRVSAPGANEGAGPHDLMISSGSLYLGGVRVKWERPADGKSFSYLQQPEWLTPDRIALVSGTRELVYLHVTEQEVTAREDDDLADAALGGPDTGARLRLLARVRRLVINATDCAGAWQQAVAAWSAKGVKSDDATMRLLPQSGLRFGFTAPVGPDDPCEPQSRGGYLGADNQLVRIRTNGIGEMLWSFDNASFLYRITAVDADNKTLTIAPDPPDITRNPRDGQAVEVLRTAAILANGRSVAESQGIVTNLQGGFAAGRLVLLTPLPPEYRTELARNSLYLRVWEARVPLTPNQAIPLGATGATVSIKLPGTDADRARGDHWTVALRPASPQRAYPERFLTDFQPPDGPRQWASPLAVVEWSGTGAALSPRILTDCRPQFASLVELSKRQGGGGGSGGCCAIAVGPTDNLQKSINAARGLGGRVRVCLTGGTYSIAESVRLDKSHTGIVLEACGEVVIRLADGADPTGVLEGLFVLADADGVELRGIRFQPPLVPFKAALDKLRPFPLDTVNLLFQPGATPSFGTITLATIHSMVGVRLVRSQNVVIAGCTFNIDNGAINAVGAGIAVSGDCTDLVVRGCTLDGGRVRVMSLLPVLRWVHGILALSCKAFSFANPATPPLGEEDPRILAPILHRFTVEDNAFVGVTAALYGIGQFGKLNFRRNRAEVCFGGIWLFAGAQWDGDLREKIATFHMVSPAGGIDGFRGQTKSLLESYPLPAGLTQGMATTRAVMVECELQVANNSIEAATAVQIVVTLNSAVPQPRASPSVIFADNRIASSSDRPSVVIGSPSTCSLTGNIIENRFEPNKALSLTVAQNARNQQKPGNSVTVSGNVFYGGTNLVELKRSQPPPFDTWAPFNAET